MKRLSKAFGLCLVWFVGAVISQPALGWIHGAISGQIAYVWTGAAAGTIPTWVSSVYGFGGLETTSLGQIPFFSVSPNGDWGGLFATRSSDYVSGYVSGLNTLVMHDNIATAKTTWGHYIQMVFTSTAKSGTELFGMENSIWNQKTVVTNLEPFRADAGDATINERLDCGVGPSPPAPSPVVDCTSALTILKNGAPYSSPAIIIADGAMDTSVIPNPATIAMPTYDAIAWYSSQGVQGALMYAGAGSPAGVVSCTSRCLYLRTDGGSGSTLYVNETGGGTSGWAAK